MTTRVGFIKYAAVVATVVATAVMVLSACSFPFSETISADTITLNNNHGYVETAVDIPSEAREPALNFSSIEFRYTVTANDLILNIDDDIVVAVSVSSDTESDTTRTETDESFEEIFNVSVNSATDESGVEASDLMVQILNDRQESFVIAADISNGLAENLITSGTIDIDIELHIEGNVTPF